MFRKHNMVFMLWFMARSFLEHCGYIVEHYNYRNSNRSSMFQICRPCIFSIWERNQIWRKSYICDRQCVLDKYQSKSEITL